MDGILPLNKDRGMTSHDAVVKCRKLFRTRKIGHSGTLDPNVDGVLPICIGKGTKVVNYLMESGKVYTGQIILGFATETEDLDGKVVTTKEIEKPFSDEEIKQAMERLTGEIIQVPPMYSAVKVNGKRLYEYARNNEAVKRPERKIRVDYFKQVKASIYDPLKKQQTLFFEVGCGKGTYVRTLAFDLGKILGVPAVMSDLTRLKSGGFTLAESVTLSELEVAVKSDGLEKYVAPIQTALASYPQYELSDKQWQLVKNGGFLAPKYLKNINTASKVVLNYAGKVRALYYYDKTKKLFRAEQMIDLE
ncbi:tRNA pseudouridine(55) synthase TruB [Ligilactobacillus faecis]|uniref:tRNA pseudouridine synthase B n=1 Tax=Ligilactobacillus faecis TaxID=762833 RepID=A0ABV4DNM2_9LACO